MVYFSFLCGVAEVAYQVDGAGWKWDLKLSGGEAKKQLCALKPLLGPAAGCSHCQFAEARRGSFV